MRMRPSSPPPIALPEMTRSWTLHSPAPQCRCQSPRLEIVRSGSARTNASIARTSCHWPASTIASPRRTSVRLRPTRFTATRPPGAARSTCWPRDCRPRTRAGRAPGATTTSSSTARDPCRSVPVTTVPAPRIVKQRSTHSCGRARSASSGRPARVSCMASRSAGRLAPVAALTATIDALANVVPDSASRVNSTATATVSSSTVSVLVSATTPCRTPNRSRISRCSYVWGIGPSSALTTSRAISAEDAPASILATKRWCPGRSTKAIVSTPRPPARSRSNHANPMSIVRPRRRSSASRSGSIPVSARTRVDLPWSTWPAVQTTYIVGSSRGQQSHRL